MSRRALPLAVWAALLSSGAVAATGAITAVVLFATGRLDDVAGTAVALAVAGGLLASLAVVLAAGRLAGGLRDLQADALRRAPDSAARRPVVAVSSELADLARAVDALHQRVRVSDEIAGRHRRDVETAGAGVFELLSGLVAAEEGARGQLAAELHDTVAQSLLVVRGLLSAGPLTPGRQVQVQDYVEDAEEQVRALMARTRPPALRDGDLASAVADLGREMERRYGLTVVLGWPTEAYPMPLANAITVYRFFQEALLNVVKHADVDDAELALDVRPEGVVARVRDRGAGFDPGQVRPERGRHVGLDLLRERARLAGGRVEVDSTAGTGTVLTLRLPRPDLPAHPDARLGSSAGRVDNPLDSAVLLPLRRSQVR